MTTTRLPARAAIASVADPGSFAELPAPRPESPPNSYVGWPLWFVGAAFIHTRRAGGLLVLGLILNALLPVRLPWV